MIGKPVEGFAPPLMLDGAVVPPGDAAVASALPMFAPKMSDIFVLEPNAATEGRPPLVAIVPKCRTM